MDSSAQGIKWDLSTLYQSCNDPKIEKDLLMVENKCNEFVKNYRWKIIDPKLTIDEFYTMLCEYEEILVTKARLYSFASLSFDADTSDIVAKALYSKIETQLVQMSNKLVFIKLEINKIPESNFAFFITDPRMHRFKHSLETLREEKKYLLTEIEEQIIAEKNITGKNALIHLFTEFTSSFRFQMPDGKLLTPGEIHRLFTDPDAETRKNALKAFYTEYIKNKIVIQAIYNNMAKDHGLNAQRRQYSDLIAPRHLNNQIRPEIINTMMEVVKSNYPIVQEYYQLKAKMLGLPVLHGYDLLAPLEAVPKKYTWDQAKKLVLEAYAEFDPEIGQIAKKFFTDKRIDAELRPSKHTGAYCSPLTPKDFPLVLLNFNERLDDVSTLAHELGHGIHDVYSAKKQSFLHYAPPLILAETASVFGEMILSNKLLKELGDDKLTKRNFLAALLEDCIGTIFRQTMYTFFEKDAHEQIRTKLLDGTELCDIWKKYANECYGKTVEWLPEQMWNWSYIPHFIMTPFYCYAYSFGNLFVLGLYQIYLKEKKAFIPKYKEILMTGGGEYPVKVAAKVGIDITKADFWQEAFVTIREWLTELHKLVD